VQVVKVRLGELDRERAHDGADVALVRVRSGLGDGHDVLLRELVAAGAASRKSRRAIPAASVGVRYSRGANGEDEGNPSIPVRENGWRDLAQSRPSPGHGGARRRSLRFVEPPRSCGTGWGWAARPSGRSTT